MARILITRPWEEAEALARQLAARGHEVLIEPMLTIVYRDQAVPVLSGIQGVLFTSANGVRAFARVTEDRVLPVFAVGNATAAAARAAGFKSVESAAGDVEALARLVIERCTPQAGVLLHVASSVRAGDLSGALTASGFTVRRDVLYDARPAPALSPETRRALACGGVDAVLLFSPRTARALAALLVTAGLGAACRTVTAVCLSVAVADAVGSGDSLPWRAVRVAERPDQEALLAVLAG